MSKTKEQRAARLIQERTGVKYTQALRWVEEQSIRIVSVDGLCPTCSGHLCPVEGPCLVVDELNVG